MSGPAPYTYLTPRDALVEAARLNLEAINDLEAGNFKTASSVADVAQSLATYAMAETQRTANQ